MIIHNDRTWLTATELKDKLGISRRTVYNWLKMGKLDTMYLVSGKRVIALDSAFRRANTPIAQVRPS